MNDIINNACEHFKKVLEDQLKRVEAINSNKDFVDFDKLDTIIIGICGGDGIGPRI